MAKRNRRPLIIPGMRIAGDPIHIGRRERVDYIMVLDLMEEGVLVEHEALHVVKRDHGRTQKDRT